MTERIGADVELATRIAAIYSGPLEGFVARRDAMVKNLRAAGRRDDGAMVKGLRKPKRVAWALDVASLEDPAGLERVEDSVAAALGAQSGAGDLRASMGALREAVRDFASVAAAALARSGLSIDDGELVNAVMAVIGTRDALDLLRAGRLVDIPEAGGLDLLAGPQSHVPAGRRASVAGPTGPSAEEAAKRELLRLAEASLDSARKGLATAERTLRNAEVEVESAERRLADAAREAAACRTERDQARTDLETAAARVNEAEDAVRIARASTSR